MQKPLTYAVHCFVSVRVKVAGVAAPSHRDAVYQAIEQFDWEAAREMGEFTEEFVEFLVDVESNDEHKGLQMV